MSAPPTLPGEVWRDIDKRFGRTIAVTLDAEEWAEAWEYVPPKEGRTIAVGWARVAYSDSLGFGAAIFAAYASHLRAVAKAERALRGAIDAAWNVAACDRAGRIAADKRVATCRDKLRALGIEP